MTRRAPNPYLSFLPMLMTFPQDLAAAVASDRRFCLVVAVLEFHRLGGFFLCFFELPTFHRINRGVDQQRRAADHLGTLHAAVLVDHYLQLHSTTDVHLAGKLRIHRIDPCLNLARGLFLRLGRSRECREDQSQPQDPPQNRSADIKNSHNTSYKAKYAQPRRSTANASHLGELNSSPAGLVTCSFSATYKLIARLRMTEHTAESVSFGPENRAGRLIVRQNSQFLW